MIDPTKINPKAKYTSKEYMEWAGIKWPSQVNRHKGLGLKEVLPRIHHHSEFLGKDILQFHGFSVSRIYSEIVD